MADHNHGAHPQCVGIDAARPSNASATARKAKRPRALSGSVKLRSPMVAMSGNSIKGFRGVAPVVVAYLALAVTAAPQALATPAPQAQIMLAKGQYLLASGSHLAEDIHGDGDSMGDGQPTKNSAGEATGKAHTFKTLAGTQSLPSIESESVSSVTQDEATLEAEINPEDLATEYEFWIQVSCGGECLEDLQVTHGNLAAASTDQAVSIELAHAAPPKVLEPSTEYAYWVTAKNSAGEATGKAHTFKTLASQSSGGEVPAGHEPPSGELLSPSQDVLASIQHEFPSISAPALVSTRLAMSRTGRVILKLSCPSAASSCTGTIRLVALHPVSIRASSRERTMHQAIIRALATGSFTITGGTVDTLALRLSATARALLKRELRMRARALVVAQDASGVSQTTQTTVTVYAIRAVHRADHYGNKRAARIVRA